MKFELRETQLTEVLTSGYIPDFEKFCYLRGEIHMLQDVMQEIRDLLGPMISNDPFEGRRHDSD